MDTVVKAYLESSDTTEIVHELELRITAFGEAISRFNYNTVVRVLAGAGFRQVSSTKLLRASLGDNVRAEFEGLLNIQAYCETESVGSAKFMQKKRIKSHTNVGFGIKTTLSTEADLTAEADGDLRRIWPSEQKRFRFMHRLRMTHDAYPDLAVDLSIVKSSETSGTRFGASDVFSAPDTCEVEVEALARSATLKQQLTKVATLIVGGVQATPFPVSADEISGVAASYTKLVGADATKPLGMRFIGPNTVTLQHTNLTRNVRAVPKVQAEEDELAAEDNPYSIHSNYVVTDKADGLRKMLYVGPTGRVYFLTSKLGVEFTGCVCDALKQSLLDGEFVETDADGKTLNLYATFDAYFVNGKDIRMQKFAPRKEHLERCVAMLIPLFKYKITVKAFFSSPVIFEACRACLAASVPYHTDGLIFTPADNGVGLTESQKVLARGTNTWDMNFKWKPLDQNTIDFKVTPHEGMLELRITGSAQDWDDPFKAILLQDTPCPRSKRGLRLFVTEEDPTSYLTTVPSMRTEEGDPIEAGMVLECRYDVTQPPYYRWIPQRVRWDKELPNAFATAHNNWQTIQRPITRGMITGEEALDNREYYVGNKTAMKSIRLFHRHVKREILRKVCKAGDNLIDFAVGVAGDLHTWRELRLSFVFGLDLSFDNVHNKRDGACVRYLTSTRVNSALYCIFVVADTTKSVRLGEACASAEDRLVARAILGQGTKKEVEMFPNVSLHYRTQFQVASMMFAVHYVFENPLKLMQFVRNVAETIVTGGFFVGTTWNGEAVFDLLKDVARGESISLGDVTIAKQYDSTDFAKDETSLGYAVDVSQSTFNQNREYLVNFDYFEQIMHKCGFVTEEIGDFETFYGPYRLKNPELDDKDQKLSFLNRYFVFRKATYVDISIDSGFKVELAGKMKL
jgi:hypothetical protein